MHGLPCIKDTVVSLSTWYLYSYIKYDQICEIAIFYGDMYNYLVLVSFSHIHSYVRSYINVVITNRTGYIAT